MSTDPRVLRSAKGLNRAVRSTGPSQHHENTAIRIARGRVVAYDVSGFLVDITLHGDEDNILEDIPFNPQTYIPRVDEKVDVLITNNQLLVLGCESDEMFSNPTLGRAPAVQLRQGSNESIPASFAWTRFSFDFKAYDTNNFVSGSGPWEIVEVQVAGLYMAQARIKWDDATTVPVDRGLRIADPTGASIWDEDIKQYETGAGTHNQTNFCSVVQLFPEGTQLSVFAAQGGGGALNVLYNAYAGPRFDVVRLGPPP